MSCALTQGYTYTGCKGGAGGIKRILFAEQSVVTSFTVTANVITAISKTGQFRQYLLDEEMGSATSPLAGDPKTDNLVYTHEVIFTIKKFTTAVAAEIKLLASNWLVAIVEDRNGRFRAYGLSTTKDLSNFLQLVSSGDATGTAMTDFNGFEAITLRGTSNTHALEVNSGIIAGLLVP